MSDQPNMYAAMNAYMNAYMNAVRAILGTATRTMLNMTISTSTTVCWSSTGNTKLQRTTRKLHFKIYTVQVIKNWLSIEKR